MEANVGKIFEIPKKDLPALFDWQRPCSFSKTYKLANMKEKLSMIIFRPIICGILGLSLLGCQSSSQSSSSSQSMPTPSSQSSSGSRSMPTPSSQTSSNSPSTSSDSRDRTPNGDRSPGSRGTDSAIGDLSGDNSVNNGVFGAADGDYTLDTLPNRVFGGENRSQGERPITSAERAKILDERLRKGYETFDGFILSERERAQNESNAAGSAQPGGAGGGGANRPQIIQEPAANLPNGQGPPSSAVAQQASESFPPPDDIPSGRDDDVVARQLREAAMNEPDEELREALWDEYRNYTGIDGGGIQ